MVNVCCKAVVFQALPRAKSWSISSVRVNESPNLRTNKTVVVQGQEYVFVSEVAGTLHENSWMNEFTFNTMPYILDLAESLAVGSRPLILDVVRSNAR